MAKHRVKNENENIKNLEKTCAFSFSGSPLCLGKTARCRAKRRKKPSRRTVVQSQGKIL